MSEKSYTLITGASSGIGREAAKVFAARGKNLILVARRQQELAHLQNNLSVLYPEIEIIVKSVDLSVSANVHQLYAELKPYALETLINNAGFGMYHSIGSQETQRVEEMLHLNIEALTILSTLFVSDYQDVPETQLINVSSSGGYTIVPNAVTYCATKFYVSAFTEGLAQELIDAGAMLRAKVLAPSATKTNFGNIASQRSDYNYDQTGRQYHTSQEMAHFLLALFDSDATVGYVDRETYLFELTGPKFAYEKQNTN